MLGELMRKVFDKCIRLPARRGPKAARRRALRAALCLSSDDSNPYSCRSHNNKYNAIKSRYESQVVRIQSNELGRI